ncbi:cyclin-dependent kinase inhibitor 1B-like isoform X2 [Mixophyes fleayi]|uniref:cyclin-dependent kinase inhibitor 1B-like isoform X2 n=1 Tax=Mixophyes fleayi TaxID=3061075 RepID=UPI003F4D77F6
MQLVAGHTACWTHSTENMRSARAILQSNGSAGRGVCRNLFGPVDHERLKMDYKATINNSLEEAKRKWNFDFANEIPLEGQYKWEKVDCLNADLPDTNMLLCPSMTQEENEVTNGSKRKQALITEHISPENEPAL